MAFDIEYLPPDQDRAATEVQETLTGTFWDVYQQGGLLTRDGILKLVSVGAGWTSGPVENMIDAKSVCILSYAVALYHGLTLTSRSLTALSGQL